MPQIRKTLVVGMNLHGEIPLSENNSPQIEMVPNNYIIKLSAVTPGVPNISTIENYNNLHEVTKELVEKNAWLNEPMISSRLQENYKGKMLKFATELKKKFIEENKENVEGIQSEYFRKGTIAETLIHQQNFVYNTDSMYKINEFNKGDLITNKLFLKFSEEELEQLGIDDYYKGFNKIVLYNFADDGVVYDIFEMLGPDYTQITLFQLIDLLLGMGVENLILIDLSCAVFGSDNNLSTRNIRNIRRNIQLSNTYGGLMKKTMKKNRKPIKKNKKPIKKNRKSIKKTL